MPLGNGKPYLKYQIKYSNQYDNYWGTDFSLNIRIYGNQYSDYNWVQTFKYDNKPDRDGKYDGFMYSTDPTDSYRKAWADMIQGDANMFFHDEPNALSFKAELTLVGRTNNGWQVIQSFSWGFTYSNEVMTPDAFEILTRHSEYHSKYLYEALFNHN